MTDIVNWMGLLPQELTKKPLTQLKIPGSHDSFTFSLDTSRGIANDVPEYVHSIPMCGSINAIIKKWSQTQTLDFEQQMEIGVRYFDIRLACPNSEDSIEVRTVHGLYGISWEETLNQINKFLIRHPKEVVIIDCNHFYGMPPESHAIVLAQAVSVFGDRLCPRTDADSITLQLMWKEKQQVILFYQVAGGSNTSCGMSKSPSIPVPDCVWTASSIKSPWANTTNCDHILQYNCQACEHRLDNQFQVLQLVATPNFNDILKGCNASLKSKLSVPTTKAAVDWLQSLDCELQSKVNVVIVDFVEEADFCQTVVSLNYE